MDAPPEWTTPPRDQIDRLIAEALSASEPDESRSVADRLPNVTIALAAAARCRRLMTGLIVLADAGLEDLMGVMLRTMYEMWVVGLYARVNADRKWERAPGQKRSTLVRS